MIELTLYVMRFFYGIEITFCAVICFLLYRKFKNISIRKQVFTLGVFLFGLGFARTVAALLDYFVLHTFGIVPISVGLIFWLVVSFRFYRFYRNVKRDERLSVKPSSTDAFDEIAELLKASKEKATALEKVVKKL